LFSRRLLESSANTDIVVSDPQNPTAAKREYLPSRFYCCDIMTNAPSAEPSARKTNSKPFIYFLYTNRHY